MLDSQSSDGLSALDADFDQWDSDGAIDNAEKKNEDLHMDDSSVEEDEEGVKERGVSPGRAMHGRDWKNEDDEIEDAEDEDNDSEEEGGVAGQRDDQDKDDFDLDALAAQVLQPMLQPPSLPSPALPPPSALINTTQVKRDRDSDSAPSYQQIPIEPEPEQEAKRQRKRPSRKTVNPLSATTSHPAAEVALGDLSENTRVHNNAGSEAAAAAGSIDLKGASSGNCPHPTYWAGLCVVCGAARPLHEDSLASSALKSSQTSSPSSSSSFPSHPVSASSVPPPSNHPPQGQSQGQGSTKIRHMHQSGAVLELSNEEAGRLVEQDASRLIGAKKLVLVLDLDHTLVNSVRLTDVNPAHWVLLEALLRGEEEQGLGLKKSLYCLREKNLWTKLRPFVHEFLEAAKEMFELHIYTMGDRHYAQEMKKLLDPHGKLFSGVISSTDSTSRMEKNLDVALVHDRLVLILDDTDQVWPRHLGNLIKVERYHFFPASLRQFMPTGALPMSLLELQRDESVEDGMLSVCLRVLREVHAAFYHPPPSALPAPPPASSSSAAAAASLVARALPISQRDVRYFLSKQRTSVLSGCRLIFSSCWPLGKKPFDNHWWKMAEALGAECSETFDPESTTHVVTGSAGTEKAVTGKQSGKYVVGPSWLQACFFRWKRMEEEDYPPPKPKAASASALAPAAAAQQQGDADLELAAVLAAAGGGG